MVIFPQQFHNLFVKQVLRGVRLVIIAVKIHAVDNMVFIPACLAVFLPSFLSPFLLFLFLFALYFYFFYFLPFLAVKKPHEGLIQG